VTVPPGRLYASACTLTCVCVPLPMQPLAAAHHPLLVPKTPRANGRRPSSSHSNF
jgi:hypothetical protein